MRPYADTTVDDDLVARTRTGDTASFAELWRRHADAGPLRGLRDLRLRRR